MSVSVSIQFLHIRVHWQLTHGPWCVRWFKYISSGVLWSQAKKILCMKWRQQIRYEAQQLGRLVGRWSTMRKWEQESSSKDLCSLAVNSLFISIIWLSLFVFCQIWADVELTFGTHTHSLTHKIQSNANVDICNWVSRNAMHIECLLWFDSTATNL